jgi:hypothetical protein
MTETSGSSLNANLTDASAPGPTLEAGWVDQVHQTGTW